MAAAIPYAIQAIPVVLGMLGNRKQGKAEERAAQLESAQAGQRAQASRAVAQRGALEERRQARLAQSALQARAGGGGPDIDRMAGDLEAEGEYRALSELYAGETGARSSELAAAERGRAGRDAASAGRVGQAASLLKFGSSMYSNFGGGGFNSYSYNNDSGGSKYSASGADVRARR